jgi:hypothetical protein
MRDERVDHATVLALKEKNCCARIFTVSSLIDIADAGRGTAPDLILQARTGPVVEVTVLTLPDQEEFL